MKRVIIVSLISVMVIGQAWAQSNDAISRFLSKYAEDESFTVVTVTKKMFSLFADIEPGDPDEKEVLEAISKIDGLRVLALENDSIRAPQIFKEAKSLIPAKEYEELMTVRHEGMDMRFLIKDSNGKISELLMIGGGTKNFFIMSLVGDIDLSQISKLSGKMKIDGFENLELLDEDKH
jgi:hypothetical protein